ncbi:hypothetical protein BA899_05195 [Spiribacter sp. SSL99]|uniref:glycosyltransferase n=1 Tax=Spiribacter sp. SSL99 TaxID=1866884 RepID=UPI001330C230|nr:glycosyltransferase [Spiribacter sp. SSL99]KAF0285244.1 hypothetical protein BA899_05195 [Spiribacter sp. SSL99]
MADRKPRILWANPYCLLDLSSGASMTVREQLRQLHKLGWDVRVIGATIFDSPRGITRLADHWEKIEQSKSKVVHVKDDPLVHNLIRTRSTQRAEMTAAEEAIWYQTYTKALDQFKPDIVYYYGGRTLDLLIGDEAHARGIPVAAYLANGNFGGKRWCRDVDRVITNAKATADYYREKDGIDPIPVGVFIDPARVIAPHQERKNVLFINPSLAKGAALVVRIAMLLEEKRPDITFEVVESRGAWRGLLTQVSAQYGPTRRALSNVTLTDNTNDMRPVYQRARLLLAPSLWWEAYGRVIAEAHMNGIPTIATNRGGLPEATGKGGFLIDLPDACYTPPYKEIPSDQRLLEIINLITRLHDDEDEFNRMQAQAKLAGTCHSLEERGQRLHTALTDIIEHRPHAT